MITPDPELERLTLHLRDAFRILVWEMFKKDFNNPSDPENLNTVYCGYYSLWRSSHVISMDFFQLKDLAIQKGFSVEELLENRQLYYGLKSNAKETVTLR